MTAKVRLGVLGPLAIWRDAEPVPLRSVTHRAVLGVLLLAEGRPVPAQHLADRVRGDVSLADARSWTQVTVSRLRSWLNARLGGAVTIGYEPEGYRLDLGGASVDLAEFRARLATARQSRDAGSRSAALTEALRL